MRRWIERVRNNAMKCAVMLGTGMSIPRMVSTAWHQPARTPPFLLPKS